MTQGSGMIASKEKIFKELGFNEVQTWEIFSKKPYLITKSLNSYIAKTKFLADKFKIVNFKDQKFIPLIFLFPFNSFI